MSIVVQESIELKPYTTWKLGGKARYFVVAKTTDEVQEAVQFAKQKSLPIFILGGGSNILVSDSGFEGLVIKIELQGITFDDQKVATSPIALSTPGEGSAVTAGSGVMMSRLAAECLQNGYTGLEWAIGLPGTVGGAVFGNSNCWGGSIGKSLTKAVLLDPKVESPSPDLSRPGRGKSIKEVDQKYFNFSYDYSKLQDTKEIVLTATFNVTKVDSDKIALKRAELSKVAAERVARQPLGKKVAGSTFKALIPTPEILEKLTIAGLDYKQGLRDGFISAGWMIDHALNLKGYEMGNVKISDLHANFFINNGSATAQDAKNLIDFVKKECKNKLDIALEEEIKYVGKF